MSAPRHLWSGDWRLESAAAAEELARRRRSQAGEPADPPAQETAAPPAPRPRSGPPPAAPASNRTRQGAAASTARVRDRERANERRPNERRRKPPDLKLVALAFLAVLLTAGLAYGVLAVASGSGSRSSRTASAGRPYLGIDMESSLVPSGSFPIVGGNPFNGVLVVNVIPYSPAAAAGLEPGDVITQIDNRPVATPAQVTSVLDQLHPGDRVPIQYAQGPTVYSTVATLAKQPARSP